LHLFSMQGRKEFAPKMLYSTSLPELVPQDNFYRRLDRILDLSFLRAATVSYYGTEGQESIDPVVFFKILLVGYLNNITSDRRLVAFCADSFSIRLFLRYDLDEALPFHSTISRTRQLYGEDVFKSLFDKVLSLCVGQGMVGGKRQTIDSAFVKANASMDRLSEKEILADGKKYVDELNEQSEYQVKAPAPAEQPTSAEPLAPIEQPAAAEQSAATEPVASTEPVEETTKRSSRKKLSNQTHESTTDPDARISTKPGKPRALNFYAQIAVDDASHVITGAMADYADKRDSDCLPEILDQTIANLASNKIEMGQIIADTNYSSGTSLRYCEEKKLDAYIPNIGLYQPEYEGFIYNQELDQFECQRGNKAILNFKGINKSRDYERLVYRGSRKACKDCPFLESCCGKSRYKVIAPTTDKEYYDRMHQKLQKDGLKKEMMCIRSKTVEPVLGTLINHRGMKRVNARGIKAAGKHVLMASLCYNLKKLLNYIGRMAEQTGNSLFQKIALQASICNLNTTLVFLGYKSRLQHQRG
jgi:transposase